MEAYNSEKDIRFSDMLQCQQQLRAKHNWDEHTPEIGHYSLLWMYDEMGEVGAMYED